MSKLNANAQNESVNINENQALQEPLKSDYEGMQNVDLSTTAGMKSKIIEPRRDYVNRTLASYNT